MKWRGLNRRNFEENKMRPCLACACTEACIQPPSNHRHTFGIYARNVFDAERCIKLEPVSLLSGMYHADGQDTCPAEPWHNLPASCTLTTICNRYESLQTTPRRVSAQFVGILVYVASLHPSATACTKKCRLFTQWPDAVPVKFLERDPSCTRTKPVRRSGSA